MSKITTYLNLSDDDKKRINASLYTATLADSLNDVRNIINDCAFMEKLTSKNDERLQVLSFALKTVFDTGNVNMMKYFLSHDIIYRTIAVNNYFFINACASNHIALVQYMMQFPALHYLDQIKSDHNILIAAIQRGSFDVVRYILTHTEVQKYLNIHYDNEKILRTAVAGNYLKIVEYVLTSPELSEHANVHVKNDRCYKKSCRDLEEKRDIALFLLSLRNEQAIDFQCTEYNLDWAVENHHDDILVAMMKNLNDNKPMDYLENLPKIKRYNKKIYHYLQNMNREDCSINSSVPELFL